MIIKLKKQAESLAYYSTGHSAATPCVLEQKRNFARDSAGLSKDSLCFARILHGFPCRRASLRCALRYMLLPLWGGKTRLRLIFMLLLLFSVNLHAQTRLAGEVLDKTNVPVPGALVDFGNGRQRVVTGDDGKFTLTYSDSLKNHPLRISAYAYKTKTMVVNKGQEYVRVVLLDSAISLRSVTVSASKHGRFSDYSAQTVQLSSFDIVTNPAAMADIIANMRVLPGVQTNDNDGRLIIQGGSPDESKYYINELMVANPYTLSSKNSGVRSRFSSDLFEGIVLQSGGFNAEFGQALSGIVNLNTKEKEKMEAKTDIALSSVFAGVTHIGQGASYAYRADLQYSNIGVYNRLFPDDYDWRKPYQQISADFFLTKEFSTKIKMTAQVNASSAGGEYSYYNVDSVYFTNNMQEQYLYAQVNLYHAFNSHFNLSVASNVIFDKLSATEVRYQGDEIETAGAWNHNKINLQYSNGKLTNRTGVEFICNPFDETYLLDLTNFGNLSNLSFNAEINNNLWSVYNDTKIFIGRNFTMSAGFRGEYSTYLKQFNFAPRFYAGYRWNKSTILSASVGNYFQLPDISYLAMSNGLDFTSATKGTLSYSYVKRNEKFQADVYYKKYKDVVTYEQGQYTPEKLANGGAGYGYGADVFWKSHFKRVEYWLTYSFNQTEKRYAYFTEEVAPSYLSQHSFNITLKYWVAPLKSLIGAAYNIASGAPYYSDSTPYEKLGDTPLRNRLDVSWSFLPKQWIIVHFGCTNVLGYRNVYGYEYSKLTPGLRKAVTSPDKRFLFVGLFITFSHNKQLNQLKNL